MQQRRDLSVLSSTKHCASLTALWVWRENDVFAELNNTYTKVEMEALKPKLGRGLSRRAATAMTTRPATVETMEKGRLWLIVQS